MLVKEIDAVGHDRAHWKEVDQPSANGVFPWAHHLAHMLVAGQGQLVFELGFIEFLSGLKVKGVSCEKGRWRESVERRGGGHDNEVCLALGDLPQRGESLTDEVLVRGK